MYRLTPLSKTGTRFRENEHINDDGTEIFDNNYNFKVVR